MTPVFSTHTNQQAALPSIPQGFQERAQTNHGKKHRKPIYGVGINDAPYFTRYTDANGIRWSCPYYAIWIGILSRCFSPLKHAERPNYSDCTMAPEWYLFSTFKAWMQTKDWKGKHLDKDLSIQGNKHYGPTTCLFVSQALNSLLCLRGNARGKWPLGVTFDSRKTYAPYVARCRIYGIHTYLGSFKTVEEASATYKSAKLSHIKDLASAETNPEIKAALLRLF